MPQVEVEGHELKLSNLDKVLYPEAHFTKAEVLDYYARIAPTILPYLQDRPVVLVRYPDGIGGKSFYQWNVPVGTPSWVRTVTIVRDEDEGRKVQCFLVNDADTLLYIANLGCIPIHVLAARPSSLELCDFITFDFDWSALITGAGVVFAVLASGACVVFVVFVVLATGACVVLVAGACAVLSGVAARTGAAMTEAASNAAEMVLSMVVSSSAGTREEPAGCRARRSWV